MENIEMNEVVEAIDTEEIKDMVVEAIPENGSALKTLGVFGLGAACGVAAYKFVAVPVGKKIKSAIQKRKASKQAEKSKDEDFALEEMDLAEIPEIEE